MLTAGLVAIQHQNTRPVVTRLQCAASFQELFTMPHFSFTTQCVMTEYLNPMSNSDDTQVLLRLVCFHLLHPPPPILVPVLKNTGLVDVANISVLSFSKLTCFVLL